MSRCTRGHIHCITNGTSVLTGTKRHFHCSSVDIAARQALLTPPLETFCIL